MRETTIGELLRESRVKNHLSLDEIEEKTGIPSHHILALELDQFNLISEDNAETYLKQYSEIVGLDTTDLLKKYHAQKQGKKFKLALDEKFGEQENLNASAKGQLKTENTISIENYESREERLNSNNSQTVATRSRVSRYDTSSKKNSSLPLVLLSLVALGILIFVAFVVWGQLQVEKKATSNASSVVNSSSNSQKSTVESSQKTAETSSTEDSSSISMTTEGGGNSLTVNLSNVTKSLDVVVSLSGADSSWVSVTNSEAGNSGTLLSADGTTSYTATLPSGTTTSLITLGVTQGVTITIDGQKIDTSALTSTSLSSITLNIQ